MSTNIKCPQCSHAFPLEDAVSDDYKKELREKMNTFLKQKEDELQRKEAELKKNNERLLHQLSQQEAAFQDKLQKELHLRQAATEERLRKSLASEFEHQVVLLKQSVEESEEKLKAARTKELDYLQKEKALKTKEDELELRVQKQLLAEREQLKEQLSKEQQEKMQLKEQEYQLRAKELEKQLEDQKKLVDQMKRKAEQGSIQLQGEVQELLLEQILAATFPFDVVAEVGKGVRGADCIQTVRNNYGQEAGKIIYESKRTKDFGNDWIEKLKADMRGLEADVAVIVTQAFPKEMDRFGEKDGVYICSFSEVRGVALLLRNGLLKVAEVRRNGENRGDKMAMLYDYLTGHEFSEQWKAITEGFRAMRHSIQKERDAMERLWKAREKQLEKVLLNAAHIRGSVEGIAGADSVNLGLLYEGEAEDPME
ncbi:MAG: DUF2130 domain-containing protein [Edaphocola sp.]